MIYLISIIAALSGFLFGYDEGVIAGSLHLLKRQFFLNEMSTGVVTGILPFGALLGSMLIGLLIATRMVVHLGRRRSVLSAGVLFIIGALLATISMNVEVLILARFILGLAIGIASVATPLYISETAPARLRGGLVAVYQLAVTLGILVAYIIDYILSEHESWRGMFAGGMIPAAILIVGVMFLPDSPRWLISAGKKAKALAVLKTLRRKTDDVQAEFDGIEKTLATGTHKHSWRALFKRTTIPVVILGMGLFFLQQLSGINAVIYYAPQIFGHLGFGNIAMQLLPTIGIGLMNVLMTIVALFLIDRLGRRKLLLIGFAGTAISLAIIAICSSIGMAHIGWIALIGLLLYIASFAISLGPIPYVVMSEIFPTNVRGPGMGLSSFSNWGFNSLVVFSFPMMLSGMGIGWTLGCYAIVCVMGLILTYIFMPETKGVPLEVIESRVHAGVRLRHLGDA